MKFIIIKEAIKRCEKFVNINIELKDNVKNIVSTPKINFSKDSSYSDSESDSLMDFDSRLNEENVLSNLLFKTKNKCEENIFKSIYL